MNQRFQIERSAVASEIVDGEAIILHHGSGDYFSTDGIGAVIWQWLGESKSQEQIARLLEDSFPRASADIAAVVGAFLSDLLKHGLIREVAGDGTVPPAPAQQATNFGDDFTPPILHVYSDMREVLLLDPIHEVEEAAGWPVPKRPHAKA
jgi:hypothetical protein